MCIRDRSIANPQQVHTNIGFRGEVHSITQGPEGPVRNPINRPSQVTRADTAETPLKPGETGWTGLEPEGYSPMNPTVQRTGETWEEARRRNAAEARKAAVKTRGGMTDIEKANLEDMKNAPSGDAQTIFNDNRSNFMFSKDSLPINPPLRSIKLGYISFRNCTAHIELIIILIKY